MIHLLFEVVRALSCSFEIQDSSISVRLRNELSKPVPVWAKSESIDFHFQDRRGREVIFRRKQGDPVPQTVDFFENLQPHRSLLVRFLWSSNMYEVGEPLRGATPGKYLAKVTYYAYAGGLDKVRSDLANSIRGTSRWRRITIAASGRVNMGW